MLEGKDTIESVKLPKLAALLEGTREADLVLGFIDLCGTKSHVADFIKNNGGTQHVLTRLQTSFSSALANVAKETPEMRVVQASDGAFLIGGADAVLKGLVKTMLYAPFFFFDPKKMSFIPMRASIASGLVRVEENKGELSKLANLYTLPFWGEAFTKVYLMEQNKTLPGIQIFATQSAIAMMGSECKRVFDSSREVSTVHIYSEGAEKYFQANWLALWDWPVFVDG